MLVRFSPALLLTLTACTSSDSAPADAPNQIDAGPPTVLTVTCPATPNATITSSDANESTYMPASTTIGLNQIVQFVMSSTHNVAPNPTGMTDAGLTVDYGQTKCLMFTHTGTFGFHCGTHQFRGTVTVQ